MKIRMLERSSVSALGLVFISVLINVGCNGGNGGSGESPLAAPSGLRAAAYSSSQINLAWEDNSTDEDTFRLERKAGDEGTYIEAATVGADVTSYLDSGDRSNRDRPHLVCLAWCTTAQTKG